MEAYTEWIYSLTYGEFLDYLAGNLDPPKEEWDRTNMTPGHGTF